MIFDFQVEERMFGMLGGVGRPLSVLVWHIEKDGVISFILLPKTRWLWQQVFAILPSRKDPLSLHNSVIHPQRWSVVPTTPVLVLNISFQSFFTTVHRKKCTVRHSLSFSYTQSTLFPFPACITICNPKFVGLLISCPLPPHLPLVDWRLQEGKFC